MSKICQVKNAKNWHGFFSFLNTIPEPLVYFKVSKVVDFKFYNKVKLLVLVNGNLLRKHYQANTP